MDKPDINGFIDQLAQLIADAQPAKVMEMKARPELDAYVEKLMAKSKNDTISPGEKDELDQMMIWERLIRLAKIKTITSRDDLKAIIKNHNMDKSLVDYSKRSWTTAFVVDDCRYAISFIEEFTDVDGDGIEPTGRYLVVTNSPSGTSWAYFEKSTESFGWETDQEEFILSVPPSYLVFISDQLKLK